MRLIYMQITQSTKTNLLYCFNAHYIEFELFRFMRNFPSNWSVMLIVLARQFIMTHLLVTIKRSKAEAEPLTHRSTLFSVDVFKTASFYYAHQMLFL